MDKAKELLNKLFIENYLDNDELKYLLDNYDQVLLKEAMYLAKITSNKYFDNKIYYRGIIEFSNYCRNDCYYCGLRKSNNEVKRYRLTIDEILNSCEASYQMGIRTFVLQGGEDIVFDKHILTIIKLIKEKYNDCAITLSLGERDSLTYKTWYEAGASRYLLRHESANKNHYEKLHPFFQKFDNRMTCLKKLKEIGYQCGAGMMIGSPYQNNLSLLDDLIFIRDYKAEMVGIGPFIPHSQTPFKDQEIGDFNLTLYLLALTRLLLPNALIPATTAMDTIKKDGRLDAILAGANVIMVNITPMKERQNYKLYNDMAELRSKKNLDKESLNKKLRTIDYEIVVDKGDFKKIDKKGEIK
ncbi:MAG: [FeFe] hydrogenase H-cluster radical SAM maturase HydE [Pleomorphochaeta sp.]